MLPEWSLLSAGPIAPGRKLGAFLGVYTPTVLTILGVILYLRFGWVAGHAGLLWTLSIVLIANGITLITTLALSAVATNSRVGVGGAYYLISRSLGLEIGGAIGVPLFLSQAFSVTLYAFGLAESLRLVWREIPVPAAGLRHRPGRGRPRPPRRGLRPARARTRWRCWSPCSSSPSMAC